MFDAILKHFLKYKDAIVASTLYDVIKLFLGMIFGTTLLSFLGNISIDLLNIEFLTQSKWYIIILFSVIFLFWGIEFYSNKTSNICLMPTFEYDYEIIKREMTY